MKTKIFIQSNPKQYFGAKISEYSFMKNSKHPDRFEVKILNLDDFPQLTTKEGQFYLRKGQKVQWTNNDLQSFTLLRFLPPQLMNFQGRALVVDPDVFALTDINELLERDMEGKSILCHYSQNFEKGTKAYRTSVMLLDCEKLSHWKWDQNIEDLFQGKRDYRDWMSLLLEDENTIGFIEEGWNQYDKLSPDTKLIHFTRRVTQPWKTGLEIDFQYDPVPPKWGIIPRAWIDSLKYLLDKKYSRGAKTYIENPFPEQQKFFFELVRDAVASGFIKKEFIEDQIREKHLRKDLLTFIKA